jgi:hypothetical protein
MSVSDPIADMLTRIRNAVMVGQPSVAMPSSTVKAEIAKILKEEGFVEGFEVADSEKPGQKVLRIKIKYTGERRERRRIDWSCACQPPWSSRLYQETRYPLGALWNGRCHSLDPEGCDDRPACPPVGRGR